MATTYTDKLKTKNIGTDTFEFVQFQVTLDTKSRKAFIKNPKQYFRDLAKRVFGKCNGVAIDSDYLSEVLTKAKKHKGIAFPMKGVKVHIPQGRRACRIIIIKRARW